jgi:aminoglycoside/choline kinase family phosphotransferase
MSIEVGAVDDPEEVTADWLTAVLQNSGHDCTVRGVRRDRIGTGQMGASYRLHLDLAASAADSVPPTLVLKIAAGNPEERARVNRGFEKEVRFYQDLAPHTSVSTPNCWFADISADLNTFVLLLDDLAPRVPGRQVDGCSYKQAIAAVENLAGLHAPLWGSPLLQDHAGWLTPLDAGVGEFLGALMATSTEQFLELYRDELTAVDQSTLRLAAAAIGPWAALKREQLTLIHGDYRLDNLMFDPANASVSAVDWQTTTSGSPTLDVSYFLATSVLPEERRRHERRLLAAYLEALAKYEVAYSFDDAMADYRRDILHAPLITVLGRVYATAAPTPEADAMFLAMATRSCAAIRDLDTLALVTG